MVRYGDFFYYLPAKDRFGTSTTRGTIRYQVSTDTWAPWGTLPDFPFPSGSRPGPSLSAVVDGVAYVFIAEEGASSLEVKVARFDLESETYLPNGTPTTNASLVSPAVSHRWAVCAYDGLIYLFTDEETKRYDPVADEWTTEWAPGVPLAVRPGARWCNVPAVLADGKIWLIGGATGNPGSHTEVANVDVFDPVANSWSAGPNLPGGLLDSGGLGADTGYIWNFGGTTLSGVTDAYRYLDLDNPVAWTAKAAGPSGSQAQMVRAPGDRIFAGDALAGSDPATWLYEYIPDVTLDTLLEVLLLTPETASTPVGGEHTVTAEVLNDSGDPVPDVEVRFYVDGVNGPLEGTDVTDAAGHATFSYTCTTPGSDLISATTGVAALFPSTTLYPSSDLYPRAAEPGMTDTSSNITAVLGGSQFEDFPRMLLGA